MNSREKGKRGELELAQARRDAREGETPVVMHRKDRCGWLVTLELEDFIARFYREWEAGQ